MLTKPIFSLHQKDNFVDPFFRPRRTKIFKTDHMGMMYKNPGHLMNPDRENFIAQQRARVYTGWEPPVGGESREGKKIIAENKPVNDGIVMKE